MSTARTDEPDSDGLETRRRRRRRGRREGRQRLATLLPHLFTTLNLAAGFYAIVVAAEGQLERAAFALIIAGAADFFDGWVARLANVTSRFGVEYDSIADTVSFAVAPAILAFNAGAFRELGWTGWVMGFMYTACAALRLARFNVTPARYRGRFEGLPSPSAAGMVLSTVQFVEFLRESGVSFSVPASLPAFGLALLGLLMVSPIPYRSFKGLRLGGTYSAVTVMVIAFAVILAKPPVTLFLIGIVYCASGPIGWLLRQRSGVRLEEAPPPSSGAPDAEQSQGSMG